ncbi:MAG: PD-(D/E)XK nuclease family protein [Nocardioides sp.]
MPVEQESPAERRSLRVDGVTVLGALSPSRASDFMTCPLLFRFRTVDRLPQTSSVDAVRGTLVHKVLEDIFTLPAQERTPARARSMLAPAWDSFVAESPELPTMFGSSDELDEWMTSASDVLDRYFTLEDPRRLEPAERELYVEALLDSKLLLRGFIDRVDVAPDGAVRVVDYKSGNSPHPDFEAKALFQMKFYALAVWRSRGVIPKVLQLMYLGNGEILTYEPDEADLLATERKVNALWQAIRAAEEAREWLPNRSRACDWCSYKAFCPAWGGTPPPVPDDRLRGGVVPPTAPRWFGRLRRWWRRPTSGEPSRSAP